MDAGMDATYVIPCLPRPHHPGTTFWILDRYSANLVYEEVCHTVLAAQLDVEWTLEWTLRGLAYWRNFKHRISPLAERIITCANLRRHGR